ALKCLGYADDSPEVLYNHRELEKLMIREDDTLRLQPCQSPVWDTAITLRALEAAGTPANASCVAQAIDWLLEREVRRPGDWAKTVQASPGGWYFEHRNEFYPDVDDTIMVLMAFRGQLDREQAEGEAPATYQRQAQSLAAARQQVARGERVLHASRRALDWLPAMQNRDGGWGAF